MHWHQKVRITDPVDIEHILPLIHSCNLHSTGAEGRVPVITQLAGTQSWTDINVNCKGLFLDHVFP